MKEKQKSKYVPTFDGSNGASEAHTHQSNGRKLDAELKEIYRDENGQIPDMSTLEHSKGFSFSKKLIVSILLLAAIAGAAWAGFLFFNSSASPFASKNVTLEVTAPFTTVSGDQYTYTIAIKNNEAVDIASGTLRVNTPYGFFLNDSNLPFHNDGSNDTKPTNIFTWNIPSIHGNDTLTLTLKGQFIGEKNIRPLMTATFKYSPANVTSTFESSASFSTDISDSIIAITDDYDNQIIQGQAQTVTVHLKNVSKTENISNLKLQFDIPDTFKDYKLQASSANREFDASVQPDATQSAEAQPAEKSAPSTDKPTFADLTDPQAQQFKDSKSILIKGLAAESELVYTLTGAFNVEENGEQQIKISAFAADSKENYLLQAGDELAIQVIKGDLITDLIINGKTENQPVSFGSRLTYLLHIKNKSKTALGDVAIRLLIDSPAVDWSSIQDGAKGQIADNQITWTSKEIKDLAALLPENEVNINLSIALKPFADLKTYKSGELSVRSYYQATVNKVEQLNTTKTFDSATIINTMNSNTQFTALGRYFDDQGQTVGSGPLPPVVGQTTSYQILWQIDNSFNELTDITISSELPAGVTFVQAGQADAGDIKQDGQKITWTINRMPTSVAKLAATFTVSITPTSKDANKLLTLANQSTLAATDKETAGSISITDSPITTDISTDEQAKGKGLVQPQ